MVLHYGGSPISLWRSYKEMMGTRRASLKRRELFMDDGDDDDDDDDDDDGGDMRGFIEEERTHSPKTYFPCQQTSWAARPKLQVLCKISSRN